jgi:predicted RNA methylase
MNPPFGTRKAGIDTTFVLQGMKYANVVYSLHKTSTREVIYLLPLASVFTLSFLQHFVRLAANNNFKLEVLAELKYDIPKMFKYHKEKSKDVYVDLYRFTHVS